VRGRGNLKRLNFPFEKPKDAGLSLKNSRGEDWRGLKLNSKNSTRPPDFYSLTYGAPTSSVEEVAVGRAGLRWKS